MNVVVVLEKAVYEITLVITANGTMVDVTVDEAVEEVVMDEVVVDEIYVSTPFIEVSVGTVDFVNIYMEKVVSDHDKLVPTKPERNQLNTDS